MNDKGVRQHYNPTPLSQNSMIFFNQRPTINEITSIIMSLGKIHAILTSNNNMQCVGQVCGQQPDPIMTCLLTMHWKHIEFSVT